MKISFMRMCYVQTFDVYGCMYITRPYLLILMQQTAISLFKVMNILYMTTQSTYLYKKKNIKIGFNY